MNVRFDSLNRFETPELFICSPGSVLDGGKLTNVLGSLVDYSDLEGIYNFNTVSELNFRAYKAERDDQGEAGYTYRLYRALQNRRLIFVDGIGYFVITNVTNGFSDGSSYKDVEASSCEIEIQSKALPYIEDGTYQFTPLLETLVSVLPIWTIGHVDSSVASKYRSFEDVDTEKNVYAFLQEDIQDAYECIVLYDIIHRQINVYDQNSYVERSSIHLTKDDLISGVEIRENADDLYTAISVTGENELGIQAVNPLGGNVIYNFDYYLDWMTSGLRSKVVQWKTAVSNATSTYYNLNQTYYNQLQSRSNLQADADLLEQQLNLYKRCRSNIVAESGWDGTSGSSQPNPEEISSYNEAIIAAGGTPVTVTENIQTMLTQIDGDITVAENELSDTNDDIAALDTAIAATEASITQIHDSVAIASYFTQEEYDELYHYIFEGEYTDEYVMITDSMTYAEQFQQMKTLYDRAVAQLTRISQPRQEFDIDVENFIFVKDFQPWAEELQTGTLINVELLDNADVDYTVVSGDTLTSVASSYGVDVEYLTEYNGLLSQTLTVGQVLRIPVTDIAALFLTSFTVNYEDQTLSMTFGNRFDRFDLKSLYDSVLGSVKKSNNTLQYVKEILYPIKNGALDQMAEAIRNSRTLTKNMVMSADNEQVIIDDTGYTGRSLLQSGEYDPRQVRITGKTMAFTDDAWETCKVALGEIVIGQDGQGNPQTVYGLNAETVIGEMIIGNNLMIYASNESGQISTLDDVVNQKIATSTNAVLTVTNEGINSLAQRVTDTSNALSTTQGELESLTGNYGALEQRVTSLSEITQTADDVRIAISTTEQTLKTYTDNKTDNIKVDEVTTTNEFTFNSQGLTIHEKNSELKNLITGDGMYVQLVDSSGAWVANVLVANNEGVNAMNLTSRQYLTIGKNSRFEDYPDSTSGKRTACFYIGG